MSNRYVLFHAGCNDGMAAAYVFKNALDAKEQANTEFIPVQYNKPLPAIEQGSKVVMLDFSYPNEVLLDLSEQCESVLIIDHHKGALENFVKLPEAKIMSNDSRFVINRKNMEIIFDNTESGATLTWEYIYPARPMPLFLHHIKARDLWTFKKGDESDCFDATLRTYPLDLKVWQDLGLLNMTASKLTEMCSAGKLLLAQKQTLVNIAIRSAYKGDFLQGVSHITNTVVNPVEKIGKIRAIFSNSVLLQSEIGNDLLELPENAEIEVAVIFFYANNSQIVFSLRSKGDTFDCDTLAKKLGGGGHKNAAGFSLFL